MTASLIAVWKGPFTEPELLLPEHGNSYSTHVKPIAGQGGSTVVLASTASQIAISDPNWWTFH